MTPDEYMVEAVALACKGEGRTAPNPPVGAVVVRDGRIVGKGFHPKAGEPHAEVFALREAGPLSNSADLYVTLEPCSHHGRTPPCADAVIAAGIARVFVGTGDPNPLVAGRGIERLRQAGIEVVEGIGGPACRKLIAPFRRLLLDKLPFVTLKGGVTLDCRIATSAGESQWITGESARQEAHRMRNRVDAILVGSGTVRADNPRLTVRNVDGGRNPVRVVVDSRLSTPSDAQIYDTREAPTLVVTTMYAPLARRALFAKRGVEVLVVPDREGQVSLPDMMKELAQRNLMHILLEGGGILNNRMLAEGLIDRICLFVAPLIFGGNDTLPLLAGEGISRLADAVRLEHMEVKRFGEDLMISGEVLRNVHRTG